MWHRCRRICVPTCWEITKAARSEGFRVPSSLKAGPNRGELLNPPFFALNASRYLFGQRKCLRLQSQGS